MYEKQNDVFYYITLENENYVHPPIINEDIKKGIIKGIYCLKNKKSESLMYAIRPNSFSSNISNPK